MYPKPRKYFFSYMHTGQPTEECNDTYNATECQWYKGEGACDIVRGSCKATCGLCGKKSKCDIVGIVATLPKSTTLKGI